MSTMLRTHVPVYDGGSAPQPPGLDQAAPTLRSAQVAAAQESRRRPAVEVTVRGAVTMGAPAPQPAPLPVETRLYRVARQVFAALSTAEPWRGQAPAHRSVLGLLGMAWRMVGIDALLAAAQAARPR